VSAAAAGPDAAGRRLDDVLAGLAGVSRAEAARWVADGLVTVDGRARSKSFRLTGSETLTWTAPDRPDHSGPPAAEDLPVTVRYEDDHLLIVSKPAGLVVHPAPGHETGTLVNALLGRAGSLSTAGGADRPGIVHRLDRDTSGLLLVAKDDDTHAALSAALAARDIERRYLALAQGHPAPEAGLIDAPVGRHPRDRKRMAVVDGGRTARTAYTTLERFPAVSLIEARLETGRTHQVRVHLASIRHPLAGDLVYGADPKLAASLGLDRPFLHAWKLGLTHPATGREIEVTEPLPDDLEGVLAALRAGPAPPARR
jgi:23S rRNA pseudouridine1911/1915/1917 synthase